MEEEVGKQKPQVREPKANLGHQFSLRIGVKTKTHPEGRVWGIPGF